MKLPKTLLTTYIIGFLLSLILTLVAYILVEVHINAIHDVISHQVLLTSVLVIAFVQLAVQLLFFLHLNKESKPYWNTIFFTATFGGVLLVVVASLWIMYHLNYNMTPQDMDHVIRIEEGIHK